MDIFLMLTLIGFIFIFCCLLLHSVQHFRCRFCVKYKYRMASSAFSSRHNSRIIVPASSNRNSSNMHNMRPSTSTNLPRHHRTVSSFYENNRWSMAALRSSVHSESNKLVKRTWQCCLYAVEEDFDFFPVSFLFYLIFILFIVLLVIIRFMILNTINGHDIQYLIHEHHHHHQSGGYELLHLLAHNLSSMHASKAHTFEMNEHLNYYGSMDWILAYCIMILSVWESLFNFYRFYTTMYAAKYFYTLETKQVLQKYAVYASIYCLIFLICIHAYYWLFPLVVGCHFFFNVFCTMQFAHILIVQYGHIISLVLVCICSL